jgi:hypothetical protein
VIGDALPDLARPTALGSERALSDVVAELAEERLWDTSSTKERARMANPKAAPDAPSTPIPSAAELRHRGFVGR